MCSCKFYPHEFCAYFPDVLRKIRLTVPNTLLQWLVNTPTLRVPPTGAPCSSGIQTAYFRTQAIIEYEIHVLLNRDGDEVLLDTFQVTLCCFNRGRKDGKVKFAFVVEDTNVVD